jgi:hypothetical protein
MYYFNEYISMVITTSGFEYLLLNYLALREEFYSQQQQQQEET